MKNRKRWGFSFLITVAIPTLLIILGTVIHTGIQYHKYQEIYAGTEMSAPPEVRGLITSLIFAIIAVLIVAAFCMTTWAYKGFIAPIKRLREATKQIRDGNLDFVVEAAGEDEIGELCADFEQMRKQLKATAEEKATHDKEASMLISNICHDLKTPITSIQGYVEGLLDGVANTPEKQEKYIRM